MSHSVHSNNTSALTTCSKLTHNLGSSSQVSQCILLRLAHELSLLTSGECEATTRLNLSVRHVPIPGRFFSLKDQSTKGVNETLRQPEIMVIMRVTSSKHSKVFFLFKQLKYATIMEKLFSIYPIYIIHQYILLLLVICWITKTTTTNTHHKIGIKNTNAGKPCTHQTGRFWLDEALLFKNLKLK